MFKRKINYQKYIYFHSPLGTYTRINKNLDYLGLDKRKKVVNVYTQTFVNNIHNNSFLDKLEDYDVIYLDEFYSNFLYVNDATPEEVYCVMKQLVDNGKQLVMAGHGNLESIYNIPQELKDQIVEYELNYKINWSYDYQIDYLNK